MASALRGAPRCSLRVHDMLLSQACEVSAHSGFNGGGGPCCAEDDVESCSHDPYGDGDHGSELEDSQTTLIVAKHVRRYLTGMDPNASMATSLKQNECYQRLLMS